MNTVSLEDFVTESGFYGDDTIHLFMLAMENPTSKSSKHLLDMLAFDKHIYENYDVEPYDEKEDITAYLPEKY